MGGFNVADGAYLPFIPSKQTAVPSPPEAAITGLYIVRTLQRPDVLCEAIYQHNEIRQYETTHLCINRYVHHNRPR